MVGHTAVNSYPAHPGSWPSTLDGLQAMGIPRRSVQAVHLPSALQQTMILATAMDHHERLYIERYDFTIPQPISLSQLDRALRTLAGKHSILRSVISYNLDHPGVEIVLTVLDPDYVQQHAQFLWISRSVEEHDKQCRVQFRIQGQQKKTSNMWNGHMLWRVSVVPLPDSRACRLSFSYHHALLDGTSARQLLCWIQQELETPDSVRETSDIMSIEGQLASWKSSDIQIRLRQRFQKLQPVKVPLEMSTPSHEMGLKILNRSVPTQYGARHGAAAVPAWMARLAVALTLCAFQGNSEAFFYETMSARHLLPEHDRRALGPVLSTQPRLVRFDRGVPLQPIAQSLRSSNDIPHTFVAGELRSMLPCILGRLSVVLACQTDISYPSRGVGNWDWAGRETFVDFPVLIELMPWCGDSFEVNLHYHRMGFSDTKMAFLHSFLCDTLQRLQGIELAKYDFSQVVDYIRTEDMELDCFLREIHQDNRGPLDQNQLVTTNSNISHSRTNIQLSQIEATICQHTLVKACGVICGESWAGESMLALIELHQRKKNDCYHAMKEIQDYVVGALPRDMVPSHFIQVASGLPRTGTGNVNWYQLACAADRTSKKLSATNSTSLYCPQDLEDNAASQEACMDYWTAQLEGSLAAEFLHDRHRPAVLSGVKVTREFSIDGVKFNAVETFSQIANVPPSTILLASLRATHYRMTGMTDANIGTLFLDGSENMNCLRIQVDDEDSFEDLVRHVGSVQEAAFDHSGVLLEDIHRGMKRAVQNSLVRMVFAFHSQKPHSPSFEEVETQPSLSELELRMYEENNAIRGYVRYASDLYTAPTIKAIMSVFGELLARGLENSQTRIYMMPLTKEYNVLEAMGLIDTSPGNHPRTFSIIDIFEQQVISYPEHVVVKDSSRQLTYAQLDYESRFLANWLQSRKLSPETTVAVLAPRSCEAIVAIVGILKAGLAYVPMDHKWPSTRVQTVFSSLSTLHILLVGANVDLPIIAADKLEMIPVSQAIREGSEFSSPPLLEQRPSPNSLAYIIFTSGSTGQPKGVMTEHRGVIARVRPPTQLCSAGVTGKGVAHMASLAFDAGNWEIYIALLNAGTLICIDSMTILDYTALDEVFKREAIRVAFITPALLKELITISPGTVSRLESLIVGGDKTDPTTMTSARRLMGSGEIVNGYGPTEHTYFSTRYSLPADELCTNGVPLGRVLPGSGAYVMDPNQSLVPLGVLGELVVTGDGLARGYTDPQRNKDRFITITVQGRQLAAYRTGDRVRYRPGDGLLEYFGRMDNQVKIRGHRIELGEIEHTMKKEENIDTAVVVLQKRDSDQESQLVAFVTEQSETVNGQNGVQHGDTVYNKDTRAHEQLWKAMFGANTYNSPINISQAGRDFLGWTSMYNGKDIDKAEMNEWLDDTIAQFCNGSNLGHVLEIGTGSGMILFNILDRCISYTGVDPVDSMMDFVQGAVRKLRPDAQDKVQLHVAAASDLRNITLPHVPQTVIVNSVAQYFPSIDYLKELIRVLLCDFGAQTLFFGDMRSYALYSHFQVSKALHSTHPTVDDVRRIMAEIERTETELLVDPAFFMSLTDQYPSIVHHVEILPKHMKACNELSCYRYAAVIHRAHENSAPVHILEKQEWIDVHESNINQARLMEILREASQRSPPLLALVNIPHRKTIHERLVVETLPKLSNDDGIDWLERLKKDADAQAAFDVHDLFQLAQDTGFRVEVSWARQFSLLGAFDAIFHRIPPAQGKARTWFQFPSDHHGRSAQELASSPGSMPSTARSSTAQRLRKKLMEQLPSYMVPAIITVLDRMPINPNGKVDRQALAQMKVSPDNPDSEDGPPVGTSDNDLEELIRKEFSRVLGCSVGPNDNFYDLGGHSLMATRAVFQIARQLGCTLSIRHLMEAPTPALLAGHIQSMNSDNISTTNPETPGLPLLPPLAVVGWQAAVQAASLDLADIVRVMPCSPFQEGVLSADMALNERSGYRATLYISLPADLDRDALNCAWREVVEREDMLRTVFLPSIQVSPPQGIAGNVFLQAILRPDTEEIRRVATINGLRAPSPDGSVPEIGLGRVPVSLSLTNGLELGQCRLVLIIHHALYDGAYLSEIIKRLSNAYSLACGRCPIPQDNRSDVSFSAFIRTLQTQDRSLSQSFWKLYLQGAPIAAWPISSPAEGAERGQRFPRVMTTSWVGNAGTLARKLHTTPAALGRAAVALVVATHSNADDVVLGEVSSGRHLGGFVAGPCIATHPVRIRLTNNRNERLCAHEIVKLAAESYADTMSHQQFGLAAIRQESEHPDLVPFQVLYVYQQASEAPAEACKGSNSPECFVSQRGDPGRVDFPLVVEAFCHESTGRMQFHCTYDPDVLSPKDVEFVGRHFVRALHIMSTSIRSVSLPVEPSQLIDSEERKMLQVFSAATTPIRANYVSGQCIHDVICRYAEETPGKIALQFEQQDFITYQQLDEMSTHLARAIRAIFMKESNGGPLSTQPLVPICFDKCPNMVIAILAVLKAGAAYVPLDSGHPIGRLTAICRAANARIVIWDGETCGAKLHTVCRDAKCSLWRVEDLSQMDRTTAGNMLPIVSPSDLAYVLFTSGSTGVPKGVMVEHRNLTSFLQARAGSTDCSWTTNRLSLLEYTFDASVGDIFATLCNGARLCLVRRSRLMAQLAQWLSDLVISHLALTPTLGAFLFDSICRWELDFPHLRTLVFGGETFRRELLPQIPREITVWNGYGPTEATIEVTACILQGPENSPLVDIPFLSIGKPIGHSRIYVLRPGTEEQVAVGVVGELCIAGPQVSRGYLSNEELTAKHFVPDPFSAGDTMYRTGDLVRWRGDGTLEYMDRMDGQMKLRGLRIDPIEITTAAETHPLVKSCVVSKVKGNNTEALVAVVQVEDAALHQPQLTTAQITQYIARCVPKYMVPAQVQLRSGPFPQTSSGKTDLLAVTRLAQEGYRQWADSVTTELTSITRPAPGTIEAQIAKHWADVLGLSEEQIDINASFAQLGGDSLRAITLLAAFRRHSMPLHMGDLRQSATIQSQAEKIRTAAQHGKTRPSGLPGYMHVYARENSVGTVVLIHPFLAQTKILEPLVPFLDSKFNVILVDDPYFGTSQGPESLTAWAGVYLQEINHQLPKGHGLIVGGYSFGGLIAMEMAMLWNKQRKKYPATLLLLDPGTYTPTSLHNVHEEQEQDTALSLLSVEQRTMTSFQEHYHRHNRVLRDTRPPPVYHGRVLYLALPERLQDSIAAWWKTQCPQMTMHVVECDDHYALLKEPVLPIVGSLINEHCCLRIADSQTLWSQ
ncbi:hypothetical protein BDV59DRAFT_204968 [Aspergillus ambiguus]|uniref:uncharacterized protein n=1 Tax=Aspergillus ambiguus TaxID=176160 RepID=UPI003CCE024D